MADTQSRNPRVAPTYQALVEHALVGVYVVQDGRIVYANPRLAELFGYSIAALLDLPSVLDLVDPADRDAVERRLRQRLESDSPTSTHVMMGRRADGTVVELDVYSSRTEHDGRSAVTSTLVDATERRERERTMQAREQRYKNLIEHAADVVYTCDLEGRMTWLNRAGQQLTGYSADEATAMRVADFVTEAQRAVVNELIRRQVRDRQDVTADFEVVTRSGDRRVLEVSTRLLQHDGAPSEIQGIARDVTERREQEQVLRSLTIIDDLTKLYNRRGFLTLGERHLKLAVRKKACVFLLFADLDGLKVINDTYGHLAGDRALVDTANILRASFRSADIIARLGGDEFTVFPIEAAAESASILMGRLEEQLRLHNEPHHARGYQLALSVGIARFEPDSSWTIDQLLEHADKALYQVKRQRRR